MPACAGMTAPGRPTEYQGSNMPKPLAGIRVIELANFIAGPLAGTLLADMGADVIKVEPPQGDMGRATPPIRNDESVSFVALNRNKRSLVLDLKRPQAIEILLKLAGKSDVFLEAYRPGALDKLGLGAAAVKAVQPLIIYTSVSGFGQTGPDLRRTIGDRRARQDADASGRADRRRIRCLVRDLRDARGIGGRRS